MISHNTTQSCYSSCSSNYLHLTIPIHLTTFNTPPSMPLIT